MRLFPPRKGGVNPPPKKPYVKMTESEANAFLRSLRRPYSYVYGPDYPAGWLFWRDGKKGKKEEKKK